MSPVDITGLDHLVLTVTDLDQTAGFYQRVLGMHPVTFGAGRRALEFGTSKINLHQAGQEITPHAARPTPGSADLCLITTTPPARPRPSRRPARAGRGRPGPAHWRPRPDHQHLHPRPRRQPDRDRQLPRRPDRAQAS